MSDDDTELEELYPGIVEMCGIHRRVEEHAREDGKDIVRLGNWLMEQQKTVTEIGENFTEWVPEFMGFTYRTARYYIVCAETVNKATAEGKAVHEFASIAELYRYAGIKKGGGGGSLTPFQKLDKALRSLTIQRKKLNAVEWEKLKNEALDCVANAFDLADSEFEDEDEE